ncbi:MAG: metallophosphoesterase family protein [Solirubrobacterales bacterium]
MTDSLTVIATILPAGEGSCLRTRILETVLALLYDIHGNRDALDAALADAADAGATGYLLGGDYCLMGARPAAVLERLRELPAATIWLRGNTERWVAHPDADDIPSPALRDACIFVRESLGHADTPELAALPDTLAGVPAPGAESIVFCHASPGSDMIGFSDAPAGSDGAAADSGFEVNTIVCGHTHVQFRREVGVVEVVNPGSVGLPFDGDRRAAYGLLGADGSIELRRVAYDVGAAIRRYDGLPGDWVKIAKRRLREARA